MTLNEVDIINKTIEILCIDEHSKQRYGEVLESLYQRASQAKSKNYRLGVIGVTSSGKSTMINALLGEQLLPAAAQPSSSQLVSCRKGKRRAKVYFENRKELVFSDEKLNSSVISKYGDESQNSRNIENVKQIELYSPNFPLDEQIVLTDSPGLDAFGYEGHEQITMNTLLPTVDFCIFVTTCKTNSDRKTVSVLDTIAKYEKPVIIIQNMIDSIVPSPDGMKDFRMVVSDHRRRLEKIVNDSDIIDKSSVEIVQISALWALKSRIVKCSGDDLNEKGADYLKRSNYQLLVDTITQVFNNLRPKIASNRLSLLKKEINQIAEEAENDSKGADIQLRFDYQGEKARIEKEQKSSINQISNVLKSISVKKGEIANYRRISAQEITDIISFDKACSDIIIKVIRNFNYTVNNICNRLNISSKELFEMSAYRPRYSLKMKAYTKTKIIKKEGVSNSLKRFAGRLLGEKWGYETVVYKVDDISGTIKSAVNYLNLIGRDFNRRTDDWLKTVNDIVVELNEALDREIRSFEERKTIVLEKQKYKEIALRLSALANRINIQKDNGTLLEFSEANTYSNPIVLSEISRLSYSTYSVASLIKTHVFRESYNYIFEIYKSRNYVISWDANCASQFVKQAFDITISSDSLKIGENKLFGNLPFKIYHFPEFFSLNAEKGVSRNMFFLINAIQIGAAIKQLNELRLSELLTNGDSLFFVIQDFREVITGEDVEGVISNMKNITTQLKMSFKSQLILAVHENPIYNLALIESQLSQSKTHNDEIKTLNNLHKRFHFLINEEVEKTLATIIRHI